MNKVLLLQKQSAKREETRALTNKCDVNDM